MVHAISNNNSNNYADVFDGHSRRLGRPFPLFIHGHAPDGLFRSTTTPIFSHTSITQKHNEITESGVLNDDVPCLALCASLYIYTHMILYGNKLREDVQTVDWIESHSV